MKRLISKVLILAMTSLFSQKVLAQASSIAPGFSGYVEYFSAESESAIKQFGCLPTDLQLANIGSAGLNYAQFIHASGALAKGQSVEFTQTICNADGLTFSGIEYTAMVFFRGDLKGQIISPSGQVIDLHYYNRISNHWPTNQLLQNEDLRPGYGSLPYGYINRLERGTWRLRLTAGKRGAVIPQIVWGGNSNFPWK
ncbi:hypothetical protein [Bdellovibrio sp. HCB337]|uniref:hypothetical protein n=1 Tax=Bdellovibrio sp. HCB337 TaxID=3394358 RepID=UPI0039A76CAF